MVAYVAIAVLYVLNDRQKSYTQQGFNAIGTMVSEFSHRIDGEIEDLSDLVINIGLDVLDAKEAKPARKTAVKATTAKKALAKSKPIAKKAPAKKAPAKKATASKR
jgi:hypothetical protein